MIEYTQILSIIKAVGRCHIMYQNNLKPITLKTLIMILLMIYVADIALHILVG